MNYNKKKAEPKKEFFTTQDVSAFLRENLNYNWNFTTIVNHEDDDGEWIEEEVRVLDKDIVARKNNLHLNTKYLDGSVFEIGTGKFLVKQSGKVVKDLTKEWIIFSISRHRTKTYATMLLPISNQYAEHYSHTDYAECRYWSKMSKKLRSIIVNENNSNNTNSPY